MDKQDCIYPDCLIWGEWYGAACEHSCKHQDTMRREANVSIVEDRQRWKLRAEKAEAEIERLRAKLNKTDRQLTVVEHINAKEKLELRAEIERQGGCNDEAG